MWKFVDETKIISDIGSCGCGNVSLWLVVEIYHVIDCVNTHCDWLWVLHLHIILIHEILVPPWQHLRNTSNIYLKDIVTPCKTLSKRCDGKDIWDMWIVYGLMNPPWVLRWEACLHRCIQGLCDDPGGCAMTSCIIIIIIYIALTLLCLCCVVLPYWLVIYVFVLPSFTCIWWSCIYMFSLILLICDIMYTCVLSWCVIVIYDIY